VLLYITYNRNFAQTPKTPLQRAHQPLILSEGRTKSYRKESESNWHFWGQAWCIRWHKDLHTDWDYNFLPL